MSHRTANIAAGFQGQLPSIHQSSPEPDVHLRGRPRARLLRVFSEAAKRKLLLEQNKMRETRKEMKATVIHRYTPT